MIDAVSRTARHLRDRLKEERGMTLAEVLAAEAIGGVVITAAATLVIMSLNASNRVSDRVNSLQHGRILAQQIDQRVSSQICLYAGEYAVNGSTVYTGAADSIVYAGSDKLIFFADINRNVTGTTGTTNSVGFKPYLRWIMFDSGVTTGTGAYRVGRFIDGYREPSNNTPPFNYSLSPIAGIDALDKIGAKAQADLVAPAVTRQITQGVTNAVTGVTTTTRIPFFQYWNSSGEPVTMTSDQTVPTPALGTIGRIRVSFKMLAESGRDSAKGSTSARKLDDRTASFASDIYLRTNPSICG